MKAILYILMYLFPILLVAQKKTDPCKTFAKIIKEGDALEKNNDFDKALDKYYSAQVAAKDCKSVKEDSVKKMIVRLFNRIKKLKNEAIKNEEKAKQAQLYAEALNLVYASDTLKDNFGHLLMLEYAFDKRQDSQVVQTKIKNVFNAELSNFKDKTIHNTIKTKISQDGKKALIKIRVNYMDNIILFNLESCDTIKTNILNVNWDKTFFSINSKYLFTGSDIIDTSNGEITNTQTIEYDEIIFLKDSDLFFVVTKYPRNTYKYGKKYIYLSDIKSNIIIDFDNVIYFQEFKTNERLLINRVDTNGDSFYYLLNQRNGSIIRTYPVGRGKEAIASPDGKFIWFSNLMIDSETGKEMNIYKKDFNIDDYHSTFSKTGNILFISQVSESEMKDSLNNSLSRSICAVIQSIDGNVVFSDTTYYSNGSYSHTYDVDISLKGSFIFIENRYKSFLINNETNNKILLGDIDVVKEPIFTISDSSVVINIKRKIKDCKDCEDKLKEHLITIESNPPKKLTGNYVNLYNRFDSTFQNNKKEENDEPVPIPIEEQVNIEVDSTIHEIIKPVSILYNFDLNIIDTLEFTLEKIICENKKKQILCLIKSEYLRNSYCIFDLNTKKILSIIDNVSDCIFLDDNHIAFEYSNRFYQPNLISIYNVDDWSLFKSLHESDLKFLYNDSYEIRTESKKNRIKETYGVSIFTIFYQKLFKKSPWLEYKMIYERSGIVYIDSTSIIISSENGKYINFFLQNNKIDSCIIRGFSWQLIPNSFISSYNKDKIITFSLYSGIKIFNKKSGDFLIKISLKSENDKEFEKNEFFKFFTDEKTHPKAAQTGRLTDEDIDAKYIINWIKANNKILPKLNPEYLKQLNLK